VTPKVVEYLKDVPSEAELAGIIKKLGIKAEQLVRKSEAIYKEEFKGKSLTEKEWIGAMIKNPKLIQRPIVIHGNEARIGRPPSLVLEIVK
jgi:arsenate reductase